MVFSVQLGWLPPNGRGETMLALRRAGELPHARRPRHLAMPALNLALFKLSLLVRLTRAGTREALLQDYVKFARAKGLPARRVIGVHVLKNILIPIVTVIGLELGSVIAFAMVTESIFAWPGTGKLLIDSINQLDRPVIVAYLLVIVTIFIVHQLRRSTSLYSLLDPRVRLGQAARRIDPGASPPTSRRPKLPHRAWSRRGGDSWRSSPRAGWRSRASRRWWSSSSRRSPRRSSRRRIRTTSRSSTSSIRSCRRASAPRPRARPTGWAPTTRAATCCRRSSTGCASRSP